MSFDAHANLAYTLVAVAPAPAASGTSLTVLDGSVFPAAPFNATVWAINEFPLLTNATIVRVTSVVGNILNFTRTAEGSPNRSILAGDQIAATITAKTLTDVEQAFSTLTTTLNISAGTTSQNVSALTFRDSNGVSFGLNGSVLTGTVATNYQSQGAYLTTAALSQDSSKYAGTNGAITGGSITVNTAGVSVNLPAYLTTAMGSNRGSDFVQATANFFGTNASGTIASDGISVSVAAQSNQSAIKAFGASNTGNTAGNTGVSTGIDWVLAGSNNITVSESTTAGGPNTLWVSGPNVAGAQTGISGIVVSDTTYTSGTVSFSNQANITIGSSVNGGTQYIRLSGNAAQTTQSAIKGFGISNTGQTAGNTGISTGIDWVLAGSDSITLSQSTAAGGPNTVWFQHPAWLTTAMASGRGTDFVQATAVFNGTNASGTIASGAISVSVAAPIPIATAVNAVASANSTGTVTRYAPEDHKHAGIGAVGISTSGNTAGTTKSVQGTYWFEGGNSITVSQITSNNGSHTLVISAGNYLTTAMASNRGSDFVAATAGFNGTNASGTIASNSISVSVAAPIPIATAVNDVASANSTGTVTRYAPEDHKHAGVGGIGISTSGNTAGTTKSVQGTYWFQGGNSITVSQITSNNGSHTLVISAGNYLTTAMQSGASTQFVQANAGFNGTNASGTIASNSISVSVAAPIPIATAVKAVASVGSTGTITRYAPEDHQHAGVAAFAVTNTGNTLGNTRSQVGTLYLAASGAITASQSTAAAGNDTVWFSVAAQTTQSAIKGLGVSNTGTTAGNTGISTGIDWVIAASGNITASQSTAGGGPNTIWLSVASAAPSPVNFSAGTTSNNLGSVVFSDSNGVSWGLSGSTITATVSTYSTVGTATTVYSVASANSVGTVTRWAAEDHRHAGIGAVGISTSGNTSGTTGSELGTYWFQGGNSITLSQITSNNGSHTLVISGPSSVTYSNFFEPFYLLDGSATSTGSISNLGVQPFTLPVHLSFAGLNMVGQGTVVPTSGSHNWSIRLTNSTQAMLFSAQYSISNWNFVDFFLFSRGTGVFSSELQTFASTRNSFLTVYQVTQSHSATLTNTAGGSIKVSQSFSMSISYPFVTSGTATSINAASSYTSWGTGYTTWTSTASNSTSDTYSSSAAKAIALASTYPATAGWSGTKLIGFNFGSSLSPGEYWLGVMRQSSQDSASASGSTFTGAAGTGASYSYTYNATDLKQTAQLTYAGKTNSIANNLGSFGFVTTNNMGPEFGLGTFSAAWGSNSTFLNGLGNPNGAIAASQLRTGVSFFQSWFQMHSNRGGV